ncbi:MAG TPA: DUF72 domain-containing protein, partial [Planctomycetes bacterium]|nr:DUF72 domain-containing protein [Planctomycetota bacterium]
PEGGRVLPPRRHPPIRPPAPRGLLTRKGRHVSPVDPIGEAAGAPVLPTTRLRCGTSSFSAKSWVGPFYPPGTKPADFLSVYGTHFDAVEVDATYYAVPSARTVLGWESKVEEGFALCAKFPRSIVHCGEGPTPDPAAVLVPDAVQAPTDAFLKVMDLLGAKCGPLVLQFP